MSAIVRAYLYTFPITLVAWRIYERKRIRREIFGEHAKLEGSKAPDFGNHPKQNLVEGGRTVEDQARWWCDLLSKKHEECVKLNNRSDEMLCGGFGNYWLKDSATLDGKPKRVFVGDRRVFERGQEHL